VLLRISKGKNILVDIVILLRFIGGNYPGFLGPAPGPPHGLTPSNGSNGQPFSSFIFFTSSNIGFFTMKLYWFTNWKNLLFS
jgi:hypothetical protein